MKNLVLLFSIIVLATAPCFAQTSAFTYQGKLGSNGAAANGPYQFEFRLFDASVAGNQIGTTQAVETTVQNGAFSTQLDFGPGAFVAGQDRWLEISVRLIGGDPYTVLTPRQKVNSVPFAVRSLQATNADNAASLAGVTAGNYVQTSDTRLSDARTPTAGSTDYIQNIPGQQSASFNITGGGTADTFNATTQYKIGGNRVLSVGADGNNVFAGVLAGQANNQAGINNSFFGFASGHSNIDGHNNAFFGKTSGFSNSTGRFNAFVGSSSGQSNVTGDNNTAIGALADVGAPNLTFATAIGAGAVVSSSDTIVLGRSTDTVKIPGTIVGTGLLARVDPKLIGMLRWDLIGRRDFPVGTRPRGVAFDGENVWVVNSSSNNVTKLRARDGACVGTCTFPVGTFPNGIAFDGENVWVANQSDLTKLRTSDGANLGTFPFNGDSPQGIAFDGANIWVNSDGAQSLQLTKLRASDGAILGTFLLGGQIDAEPGEIVFDGTNIWTANKTSRSSGEVNKVRASDGVVIDTFPFFGPFGIAFDGANVWVTSFEGVTKLRASDGANLGQFSLSSLGIAFDGSNMWVTGNGKVTKLGGGGESLGIFTVSGGTGNLAFDGANMWITNFSSNTVTKLPVGP